MSLSTRSPSPATPRILAATVLALAAARYVGAQEPARLSGRVIDRVSAGGVAGADITLLNDGRVTTTDSAGRYTFGRLPTGTVRFLVRAFPYRATPLILALKPGEDLKLTIELDSTEASREARELPAVAVSAPAPVINYRLVDFDRRRRTGRGQYLTDEEIKASGAASLQDATRGMRGVTLHCGGTNAGGCRIQMVRAKVNCEPEYVVDEHVDNYFGPLTPIRDIMALEVYTGPSDVPGEFAGRNAGCGVIVIWTRAGPPPKRR